MPRRPCIPPTLRRNLLDTRRTAVRSTRPPASPSAPRRSAAAPLNCPSPAQPLTPASAMPTNSPTQTRTNSTAPVLVQRPLRGAIKPCPPCLPACVPAAHLFPAHRPPTLSPARAMVICLPSPAVLPPQFAHVTPPAPPMRRSARGLPLTAQLQAPRLRPDTLAVAPPHDKRPVAHWLGIPAHTYFCLLIDTTPAAWRRACHTSSSAAPS